jgi:hypothetical protein
MKKKRKTLKTTILMRILLNCKFVCKQTNRIASWNLLEKKLNVYMNIHLLSRNAETETPQQNGYPALQVNAHMKPLRGFYNTNPPALLPAGTGCACTL